MKNEETKYYVLTYFPIFSRTNQTPKLAFYETIMGKASILQHHAEVCILQLHFTVTNLASKILYYLVIC